MTTSQFANRWSRRDLAVGLGAFLAARPALAKAPPGEAAISPAAALKRLMDGNARYVAGHATHADADAARRMTLVRAQHPFATILSCADSRVGPELIFDQGLGSLFVCRVAGNVVDDVVQASIEYSVVHLGVPLVLVLGHQHCGAVAATADALAGKSGEEDRGTKIAALADLIAPAVRDVPPNAPDKLEAAILLNARNNARKLLTASTAVSEHVRAGKVEVASGVYHLSDGRVTDVVKATA
jgi:carbonic anhydrase